MSHKPINELVNKLSLETELKKLRQKVAHLETKLASERLAKKAANRELRLLTSSVPWRVIAIWRQIARFIPLPLIRGVASIVNRLKSAKKPEFSSGPDQSDHCVHGKSLREKVAIVTDCDYWALANTAR